MLTVDVKCLSEAKWRIYAPLNSDTIVPDNGLRSETLQAYC